MRFTSDSPDDDSVGGVIVRPLGAGDGVSARALVEQQFGGTRYCARLIEQVGLALNPSDVEYRGLVALDAADGGTALGVVLFGEVAGASAVVKVHALVGSHGGALRFLVAAVEDVLGAARVVLCEVADEPVFSRAVGVLVESGFVEEARAVDLVAEGIAQRFLVRREGGRGG